jgi:hypothetical protein
MKYVITDGRYFINSAGGQHVVNSLSQATKMERIKAENVIRTLPKILRKYDWVIKEDKIQPESNIRGFTLPNNNDYYILDKVIMIESFAKELKERREYLRYKLSQIDMEICDISHAAEFYTLNASQGYKIYKLLHESRIERRKVKDEMEKIRYILEETMNGALANRMSKKIIGLDNRQYSPRVLKELFGA